MVKEGKGMSEEDAVMATFKAMIGSDQEHMVAEGDGPVDAFNKVMRKALEKYFPCLIEFSLQNYEVRKLCNGDGSAAIVGVVVTFADQDNEDALWSTLGFSTNVIKASWYAMVHAMNYKLMKTGFGLQ